MNRPTFTHGVVVAAILAFASGALAATLTTFVDPTSVARLLVAGISLAYITYLLRTATVRTGLVTTLTLWSALALATWWLSPPMPFYVLIHVGAIWLVRSLYFYTGMIPALIDLGLSGLAACLFAWAGMRTGSAILATWCFFLVQSFFVLVPTEIGAGRGTATHPDNASFERARRQADDAIRTLIHKT